MKPTYSSPLGQAERMRQRKARERLLVAVVGFVEVEMLK
jgi:hypothetical protein